MQAESYLSLLLCITHVLYKMDRITVLGILYNIQLMKTYPDLFVCLYLFGINQQSESVHDIWQSAFGVVHMLAHILGVNHDATGNIFYIWSR